MKQQHTNYDTVVIGGGQAGLSVGYYLKQSGRAFIILDASERIGDTWRNRWDSLRVFTPARYCGLDGMPFPAPPHSFPTKDEMASYLETYASKFDFPIRLGTRVDTLTREDGYFVIEADNMRLKANNVVVAMAEWQKPHIPSFANELDDSILQLHSKDYRNPSQLQKGDVLIVGAANSGAEIAMDVIGTHQTSLSGTHPGYIPFRIDSFMARLILVTLVLRVLFHHIITTKTPVGRKMLSRFKNHGMPLVRTKPDDIAAAGIKRVPRTIGTQDGLPVFEDGQVLDVRNVIWCTGFKAGFSWIKLPIFNENHELMHELGVIENQPGLYFVGQTFIYAASSSQIHGVGRDAKRIVKHIINRASSFTPLASIPATA